MFNTKPYEDMMKLDLPDGERAWVSARAGVLTASFTALEDINTDGIDPLVTVLDIQNVLREDISVKMLPRGELLASAPEQYGGYFQVPRTLD